MFAVWGVVVTCLVTLHSAGVSGVQLVVPAFAAVAVLALLLWLNLRARKQWLRALSHDATLLANMVGRRAGLHLGTELYTEELRPLSKLVRVERKKLLVLGLTDPLCDIGNRRALEHWLHRLYSQPETRTPVSVLLIDLDRFKEVNDQYGHHVGDEVIKRFVAELKRRIRECDLIARMGGDEFCVVFPQTRLSVALALATRLRVQLPVTIQISNGVYQSISWTGGLSVTSPLDMDHTQVLKRADLALLEAKKQGRNQTKIYDSANPVEPAGTSKSVLH